MQDYNDLDELLTAFQYLVKASESNHGLRTATELAKKVLEKHGVSEDYPYVPVLTIDRDDPEDEQRFHRWGGDTVFRMRIIENGKQIWTNVSARISGDSRAGSTQGIHLSLTAIKKNKDTVKSLHAKPWNPIKEDD